MSFFYVVGVAAVGLAAVMMGHVLAKAYVTHYAHVEARWHCVDYHQKKPQSYYPTPEEL